MREGVYRFASDRRPGLKKKFGINLSKSIKNLCVKSILNSGGFEVTEEPSDTPRSILIEFPADDSEVELVPFHRKLTRFSKSLTVLSL